MRRLALRVRRTLPWAPAPPFRTPESIPIICHQSALSLEAPWEADPESRRRPQRLGSACANFGNGQGTLYTWRVEAWFAIPTLLLRKLNQNSTHQRKLWAKFGLCQAGLGCVFLLSVFFRDGSCWIMDPQRSNKLWPKVNPRQDGD